MQDHTHTLKHIHTQTYTDSQTHTHTHTHTPLARVALRVLVVEAGALGLQRCAAAEVLVKKKKTAKVSGSMQWTEGHKKRIKHC